MLLDFILTVQPWKIGYCQIHLYSAIRQYPIFQGCTIKYYKSNYPYLNYITYMEYQNIVSILRYHLRHNLNRLSELCSVSKTFNSACYEAVDTLTIRENSKLYLINKFHNVFILNIKFLDNLYNIPISVTHLTIKNEHSYLIDFSLLINLETLIIGRCELYNSHLVPKICHLPKLKKLHVASSNSNSLYNLPALDKLIIGTMIVDGVYKVQPRKLQVSSFVNHYNKTCITVDTFSVSDYAADSHRYVKYKDLIILAPCHDPISYNTIIMYIKNELSSDIISNLVHTLKDNTAFYAGNSSELILPIYTDSLIKIKYIGDLDKIEATKNRMLEPFKKIYPAIVYK